MSTVAKQSPGNGARRVLLIGAGGTIAMVGRSTYDWVEYGESGIIRDIAEVVQDLPPSLPGVEVELISFRTLASTGIEWRDWVELGQLVRNLIASRPDAAGIVITHGTASLEDTAWFLQLTANSPVPVVLVGAQRPPNTSGSDAAANLRAALAVASSGAAVGQGVLVVMNNYVYAARDVKKNSNFALDAFTAQEFGPLGRVEADGAVTFRRRPLLPVESVSRSLVSALDVASAPRVDMALSYPGADGTAIRAFMRAGAKAIISIGMPPGRCTPRERDALREAVAAGVLVFQSSRAAMGAVVPQLYNSCDGIESGGDLAPNKLRVLLMVALAAGLSRESLRQLLV